MKSSSQDPKNVEDQEQPNTIYSTILLLIIHRCLSHRTSAASSLEEFHCKRNVLTNCCQDLYWIRLRIEGRILFRRLVVACQGDVSHMRAWLTQTPPYHSFPAVLCWGLISSDGFQISRWVFHFLAIVSMELRPRGCRIPLP